MFESRCLSIPRGVSRANGGVLRKRGEAVDPGDEGRESAYERIEAGGMDFSGMMDSVESKSRVSGLGEKLTPRRLLEAIDLSARYHCIRSMRNMKRTDQPGRSQRSRFYVGGTG